MLWVTMQASASRPIPHRLAPHLTRKMHIGLVRPVQGVHTHLIDTHRIRAKSRVSLHKKFLFFFN